MAASTLPLKSAEIVRFPRAKKRGAKVRKGPMATLLHLPSPMTGDALRGHWAWLMRNHKNWENEDPNGTYEDREEWDAIVRICGENAAACQDWEFNESTMRRDVAAWRTLIEKRIRLKDWLEGEGIDWKTAKNPQAALEFLYERSQIKALPPCA